MKLTQRYKVWLTLEAETPLSLGSGRESITVDRLVMRNAAGFPYIPGTSLAGVLRHSLENTFKAAELDSLFGFTLKQKGQGSRIIVNSAHLLAHDGKVVLESIPSVDLNNDYYKAFQNLPERDYVSINERGVAKIGGKFDAELLHKGIRFVTSIELLGTTADKENFKKVISQFSNPSFRIGGGTRKGYGKLKVIKLAEIEWDLTTKTGVENYLAMDNSLNIPTSLGWVEPANQTNEADGFTSYSIKLNAKDFFMFGAGYGDDEADATYKTEKFFSWESGKPLLVTKPYVLIPATSVKGALRHRVAFHYNKIKLIFADQATEASHDWQKKLLEKLEQKIKWDRLETGPLSEVESTLKQLNELEFADVNPITNDDKPREENEAVKVLFGFANDSDSKAGQRGNVLLQDIYLESAIEKNEKVFDHVKIDRYTGGATDGALFQEKTIQHKREINITILVKSDILLDEDVKKAWHHTLDDLCNAKLALGGRSTKGHGLFTGNFSTTEN